MDFVKMEGLGNDFVVVDAPFDPDPSKIGRWCDRRFGVGADGVIEVAPLDIDRVRMRYWNADGGEAEMCGNGLRCVARLAYDRAWVRSRTFTVETAMGDMPAEVLESGLVRALVGTPRPAGDPVELAGVVAHLVSVGNPHAVVFVDDPDRAEVGRLGPEIETDRRFPERTNVEFVAVSGTNMISMRIWERGVGETMASGTGATAAAFAASRYRGVDVPVTVHLPGGDLMIELDDDRAWMVGPGRTVYRGSISDDPDRT